MVCQETSSAGLEERGHCCTDHRARPRVRQARLFFAGCCHGAVCNGTFCVTFHDTHSLAPLGVPLYPTQLMESGGEFLIFGALMVLWHYRKFDGQLFWMYPLMYSVLRFIIEFSAVMRIAVFISTGPSPHHRLCDRYLRTFAGDAEMVQQEVILGQQRERVEEQINLNRKPPYFIASGFHPCPRRPSLSLKAIQANALTCSFSITRPIVPGTAFRI